MRSIIAIPLLLMISFTGIRIDYSAHLCGGTQVASRISLTGENATCGMEGNEGDIPSGFILRNHCCENISVSLSFCNNYVPESALVIGTQQCPSLSLGVPCIHGVRVMSDFVPLTCMIRPPGDFHPGLVTPESLRILRI